MVLFAHEGSHIEPPPQGQALTLNILYSCLGPKYYLRIHCKKSLETWE